VGLESGAVQTYASSLGKVLPAGVLVKVHGGYRLDLDPDQVDALRLEAIVAEDASPGQRL
jgi:hypothetical protein